MFLVTLAEGGNDHRDVNDKKSMASSLVINANVNVQNVCLHKYIPRYMHVVVYMQHKYDVYV